ncbi:High affinity copper uptake protein 1 [Geodia barretti]|nr:High affinity copper uptake protein 1 [Geodia barretti]
MLVWWLQGCSYIVRYIPSWTSAVFGGLIIPVCSYILTSFLWKEKRMDHSNAMEMNDNMMEMNGTAMHHMGMGMGMHMMMFFHFSKDIPHFLFESWSVQTTEELVGAIVFSFALAVVYEGLKTVRNMVAKKTKHFLYQPNQEKSKISMELDAPVIKCRRIKLWLMRVVLALMRTVEIGLAYILMLLAMTYNGWLFLSVILGAGFGFFIFLIVQPSNVITDDHCG